MTGKLWYLPEITLMAWKARFDRAWIKAVIGKI